MAIYQRGRIWYADYYANGERIQESTGTANRREAEKYLAMRLSEVQRSVFVKPNNVTLNELGKRYIDYAKLHKRSWKRDVQMLEHLSPEVHREWFVAESEWELHTLWFLKFYIEWVGGLILKNS